MILFDHAVPACTWLSQHTSSQPEPIARRPHNMRPFTPAVESYPRQPAFTNPGPGLERTSRTRIRFAQLLLLSVLACGISPISAQPEGTTAGEIALLPEFCRDKEWAGSFVPPERKTYWRGIMGQSWEGIHHYCWALVHVRRATSRSMAPEMRTHLLNVAVSDYHYAIENSASDFVLAPEMLLKMGEAHVLLRNYPAAVAAFERSMLSNPQYWPAYQRLADVYVKTKLPQRARQVLIDGLRVLPQQPQLLAMLKDLGGKPPEIAAPRDSKDGQASAPALPGVSQSPAAPAPESKR